MHAYTLTRITVQEPATTVFGDACMACSTWLRRDADVMSIAQNNRCIHTYACRVQGAFIHTHVDIHIRVVKCL